MVDFKLVALHWNSSHTSYVFAQAPVKISMGNAIYHYALRKLGESLGLYEVELKRISYE